MDIKESLKNSVTCDQARYIHAIWLPAAIGLFACASFVYWLYRELDPSYATKYWFAISVLNTLYQLIFWIRFFGIGNNHEKAKRLLKWTPINGIIAGLVWLISTVVVLPLGGDTEQFIYIFLVLVIGLSSIFSVGPHQYTFYGFFLACIAPLIFMVAMSKLAIAPYFTFVLVCYCLFSSTVAFLFSKMFLHALKLRLENVDLLTQVTEQKEAAESANLAKSRFLAAASHDLRQPMHALNLYLGAMTEEKKIKEHPLLKNAKQCANTMEEMFRALLDISRLDAEVVKPEFSAFLIGPFLERICSEFEPEAAAKNIELRFVPTSLIVLCDEVLLGRILRNLISNAVRYTERGKILIGCRRSANLVNIWIMDTGIGIPKETQKTIFEEFYQVGNSERDRNKGLGLGLAIVDRIVKLMDVQMNFQSEVGKGTKICMSLQRSHSIEENYSTIPNNTHNENLAGKIAAVVDDEVEILLATKALLESWDMNVYTAADGESIKHSLVNNNITPDVLICDYRLRDMQNGLDVINMIREEFNLDIPALLITGDTAAHRIQAIETSGLVALHKPIDKDELQTALRSLINK